jgi:hypothetical protein
MKNLIIILLLLVVSCGTKLKSEAEVVEQEPASVEYTDSDADGVIDYIEYEDIEVAGSQQVEESVIVMSPPPPRVAEMEVPLSSEVLVDTIQFTPTNADGVGRLVYEIPTEMIKFKTYTIEVRIGENENDVTIIQNIQPTDDAIIRTSELMQVELVDPTGSSFKIISQSAQQLVEYNEYTTWIFYVTPLRHGENYISVVVSIVKNGNLKQTVYNDSVLVQTSTWIEVKTFIGNYWQWIIGFLVSVIIPFGIWFYKYLKRTKETS